MIRNLLVVAAVAAAAVSGGAAPASAGCYGTDQTVLVCVDPSGSVLWEDCVHTGSDPCTPVVVPGPVVDCDLPDLVDRLDVILDPDYYDLPHVDCLV